MFKIWWSDVLYLLRRSLQRAYPLATLDMLRCSNTSPEHMPKILCPTDSALWFGNKLRFLTRMTLSLPAGIYSCQAGYRWLTISVEHFWSLNGTHPNESLVSIVSQQQQQRQVGCSRREKKYLDKAKERSNHRHRRTIPPLGGWLQILNREMEIIKRTWHPWPGPFRWSVSKSPAAPLYARLVWTEWLAWSIWCRQQGVKY